MDDTNSINSTMNNNNNNNDTNRLKDVPELNSNDCYEHNRPCKGIIRSIKLWSFMCHDYLEFDLSDHVNFVIGRNGSGKSAILSGIIIGLGGKSQATNRGSTLSTFIKKNHPSSTVEITLNNIDSYKTDEFGSYIIVRRRFNHDGVSFYSISGQFGLVSNRKDELDAILDYFNIQVENPTTILNQDLARNFLVSSSTSDKYAFFLKSTQLDQIYELVNFAMNEKKKTQMIIEHKEQMLPNLAKEIKTLEQKMNNAISITQLRDQVRNCSVLIAWILVKNKEQLLETYIKKKTILNNKIQEIDKKIEKLDNEKSKHKLQHSELLKTLGELQNKLYTKQNDEMNQIVTSITSSNDDAKKILNNKRQIVYESQVAHDTLLAMEKKISQLQNEASKANDEMRNDHKQKENRLIEDNKTLVVEYENMKSLMVSQKSQLWHHDDKLRMNEKSIENINHEIQKLDESMESYHNSRRNRILIFHPKMNVLLMKIDHQFNEGKFSAKPIGPLGNEISLKSNCMELGFAAETALKSLINAFIVNCASDAKHLDNLASKLGISLKIIIDSFKTELYDSIEEYKCNVPKSLHMDDQKDLSGSVFCLYDIITFNENPQVLNTLVDQLAIESILIFNDTNLAQRIMSQDPPKQCFKAYTRFGDLIELKPYRFYSNKNNHFNARYLAANIDDILFEIEKTRKEKINEIQEIKNLSQEIDTLKQKVTQEIEESKKNLENLKIQILAIENKLEELKNLPIVSFEDINIYKKEYEDQKVLYDEKCAIIPQLESQFNEICEEIKLKTKKKDSIDYEIQNLKSDETKINLEISKLLLIVKRFDSAIDAYNAKKFQHQTKLIDIDKNIVNIKEIILDYSAKAQSVSDRKDTDRTIEDLESEIDQTEEIIKLKEEEFGDEAELAKMICLKKNRLRVIEEELNDFKQFLVKLDDSILKRIENHLNLRNSMTTRACLAFDMILRNRGYKGDIIIDHENHILDLSIHIPSSNYSNSSLDLDSKSNPSKSNKVLKSLRNSKSIAKRSKYSTSSNSYGYSSSYTITQSDIGALSGGERSFATICFIVALWRTMNTPLRCLDEFDVFMDMVNRRYSMDLLLNLAQSEQNSNVQFIFLTPLDMSYLKPSKFINIYKIQKNDDCQDEIN